MDSKLIMIVVLMGLLFSGTAFYFVHRYKWVTLYYVKVSGYWDSSAESGRINDIEVTSETVRLPLAVSEGGAKVEVQIRSLDGELLKSKCENINGGEWSIYIDVTSLIGKTVKVKAKLIVERLESYGIPQPIIIDEMEKQITIPGGK